MDCRFVRIFFFYFMDPNLLRVIEETRLSSGISEVINDTFIALIPKNLDPRLSNDFWPYHYVMRCIK